LTLRARPVTEPAVGRACAPHPLVLASASPRRRDLLARTGLPFEVVPADVVEEARAGEAPRALVERLAAEKAASVRDRLPARPRRVVLGSDTIVTLDGEILGKPRDAEDAVAMLRRLAGRTHTVWTGVAVAETGAGAPRVRSVESRVTLRAAGEAELRAYVASGEPLDKAGAYALQGEGRRLVSRVEGSESNVIGLPLEETLALLAEAGLEPPRAG
jgi:septum formation protein